MSAVIGFLPLLIVYAALVWSRLKRHAGRHWRRSLLEAAVIMGAGTVLGTEIMGALHALRPAWVGLAWVLAALAAAGWLWSNLRHRSPVRDRVVRRIKVFKLSRLQRSWQPLEIATLLFVAIATGLVAWFSPPTNFDSMTYHLPRVMHWFQQGSLEHYPTGNIRQLAYGPGAAYWQVQLWSLGDGDRGANLPQWTALLASAFALSVWLGRLFDRRTLAPAVLAAITLPMALLQATSTQTDLLVGCWLLIAVVLLGQRDAAGLPAASLAGLAFGLAVATKPSAGLLVAPIAILTAWQIARESGPRPAIRASLVWATIALLVCLPHFHRNQKWFGRPLGDDFGTKVESISPSLAAANAARWAMLEIPSLAAWQTTARAIESAGIDANHRAITFRDYKFSPPSAAVVYRLLLPDEDFAAYTVSFLLVALLGLAAWTGFIPRAESRSPRARASIPWLAALAAILALHVMLLKWQFWGNRLLLPWTLLAVPLLVALTGVGRQPRLRTLFCGLLLLQAVFVLTFSLNRPLVSLPAAWRYTGAVPLFSASRTELFFAGYNAETEPVCRQLVAAVRERHWRRVGLTLDENYPEYALWRALHEAGLDGVELHHVSASPPPGRSARPWPPAVDGHISISSSTR